MKCIQEDRIILKLGEDKKSIYATKCCFKPEEVVGGLSFEQIKTLGNQLVWKSNSEYVADVYWGIGNWCKDIFSREIEGHSFEVFPQCKCTMGCCDYSKMNFRTVVVNFSHACNLRCKHCFYDKTVNKEIQNMYFEALTSLSREKCDVALTEEGEPFIDKERTLYALQNFTGELHKAIFFTTNATLIDREYLRKLHNIAKLKGVYYSFVVSCDGITPETYKEIRGVDKFNQVIENIKTIIEFGEEDNWINLDGINFVVQPDNLKELPKVKEFFGNLHPRALEKLNIIPFISDKNIPETKAIEDQVLNSQEWKDYLAQK